MLYMENELNFIEKKTSLVVGLAAAMVLAIACRNNSASSAAASKSNTTSFEQEVFLECDPTSSVGLESFQKLIVYADVDTLYSTLGTPITIDATLRVIPKDLNAKDSILPVKYKGNKLGEGTIVAPYPFEISTRKTSDNKIEASVVVTKGEAVSFIFGAGTYTCTIIYPNPAG